MQAMGIVNDHLDGCSCRNVVEHARTSLARPYLAAEKATHPRRTGFRKRN
jgi:hypothetical protein